MSDDFGELLERVQRLTGLGTRDAAKVAFAIDDETCKPAEIFAKARELGIEIPNDDPEEGEPEPAIGPEISMDPVVVLTEVYRRCPRVMMTETPKPGRVPDALRELAPELADELPADVQAMLAKVNVIDGELTAWVYDAGNQIDREIGPLDLRRYKTETQLMDALLELFKRLPRVLAADLN